MLTVANSGQKNVPAGVETILGTIAGAFDAIDGYASSSSPLTFFLYATVGTLRARVAQAIYAGPTASVLQWLDLSGKPVQGSLDVAGSSFDLVALSEEAAVAQATLAGCLDSDFAAAAGVSGTVALPLSGEVTITSSSSGPAERADVSASFSGLPPTTFTLYASCGAGSVEGAVASIPVAAGSVANSVLFRGQRLPVGTSFRVGAARTDASRSTPNVSASIGTYSPSASSSGASPNPSWTQAAWFIDPVNGNDGNDGKTAATAVKSYNGGVVARWGTTSPVLRQDTTLTWLSSQPVGGADPVILKPICAASDVLGAAAVVIVQGLLDASTRVASGVIPVAGFAAKNRVTGQLLQADLGFAASPGMLVHNTTAGKDSYAVVYKLVAGTTFLLAQPIASLALPVRADTAIAEVDTWAANDTFDIYSQTEVNLVETSATIAALDTVRAFPNPVQIQNLAIRPFDGVAEDSIFEFHYTIAYNCACSAQLAAPWTDTSDMNMFWVNCYCNGSAETFNPYFFFAGGVLTATFVTPQLECNFDYDAIVDTTAIGVGGLKGINAPLTQGLVYIAGLVVTTGEVAFKPTSAYSASCIVWGPGTLGAFARSRVLYSSVATAVATFRNAGGLTINQSANANPFNEAAGTWGAALAVTPANLDAAFGAPGFGGRAVNPGGACFDGTGQL